MKKRFNWKKNTKHMSAEGMAKSSGLYVNKLSLENTAKKRIRSWITWIRIPVLLLDDGQLNFIRPLSLFLH